MANVDFSEQIADFESAIYGEQVRESLIDIAEDVETAINNQLITVDDTLTESGQGADAKKVGDELSDLRSALGDNTDYILSLSDADAEAFNSEVIIPCVNASLTGNLDIAKYNRLLVFDKQTTSSADQRFSIYGELAYSSNAPTYANRPAWYHDPCDGFVVGHKYRFGYKLLSGTIDKQGLTTDFYFDLRTQAGDKVQVGTDFDGWEWTCTFVPEMIAFCGHMYLYSNAVIRLEVVDLTAREANDPLAERVETLESAVLNNSDVDNLKYMSDGDAKVLNNALVIPCVDSSLTGNLSIDKFGRILKFDGYTSSGNNQRFSIYGNFAYSGTNPTYASKPEWYHDPLTEFVIGHTYRFGYKLLDGTIDRRELTTDFYYDLRTASGSRRLVGDDGDVTTGWTWECTFIPEMIAFCGREFSYEDAVIYMEIVDITDDLDSELNERVDTLESDVSSLEEKVNTYEVPSYFETALTTAINKINSDINSDKTVGTYGTDIEAFIFLTDVHWNSNKQKSPALIKRIIEQTPVNTVICGGDIIAGHNSTKTGACAEIRDFTDKVSNIPNAEYYAIFGNHDDNSNSNTDISTMFTKQEQFNLLYGTFANQKNVHWIYEDKPEIFSISRPKADFYVDHPATRTRFLCLDWNNPIETARGEWITSVLAKDDDYRVIVLYHGIYAYSSSATDNITAEHTDIMSYLEPYKSKVVAVVSGHVHQDHIVDYFGDGSIPVIITACDTFDSTHNTGMIEGTATEQCFDVFVFDYGNKVARITRVGNGSNRTATFTLGA